MTRNQTAYKHALAAFRANARGNYSQARSHYEEALVRDPEFLFVLTSLAWILATCPDAGARDGIKAVKLSRQAVTLANKENVLKWYHVGTLAAANAELGDFPAAVDLQEKSMESTPTKYIDAARSRLKLYRSRKPYRE